MTIEKQDREVESNYEAFRQMLDALLETHRDEYVLMRRAEIVAFHRSANDALRDGRLRYKDEVFSIQEVTDVPIDLGFFSHAVYPRLA